MYKKEQNTAYIHNDNYSKSCKQAPKCVCAVYLSTEKATRQRHSLSCDRLIRLVNHENGAQQCLVVSGLQKRMRVLCLLSFRPWMVLGCLL